MGSSDFLGIMKIDGEKRENKNNAYTQHLMQMDQRRANIPLTRYPLYPTRFFSFWKFLPFARTTWFATDNGCFPKDNSTPVFIVSSFSHCHKIQYVIHLK